MGDLRPETDRSGFCPQYSIKRTDGRPLARHLMDVPTDGVATLVGIRFRADRGNIGEGSGVEKRILILTLFSGENEFESCRRSVNSQTYVNRDQRVFEKLPNAEAHARLYETIAAESERYDLFFKLDADMVLADDEVLSDLVGIFEERPQLDHLVVAVTDWMSDSHVIGAHLFSNRVRWRPHAETLHVDPDPDFPGLKLVVWSPPRDLILHAPDPSPLQAFHVGAHRGLKSSQAYRRLWETQAHNARLQWRYLEDVWRHFQRSGDRRLGLAVLAADMAFRKELPATANEYSDEAVRRAFTGFSSLEAADISAQLEARWGTSGARRRTWRRTLGPLKAAAVGLRGLRDATAAAVKTMFGGSPPAVEIGSRT